MNVLHEQLLYAITSWGNVGLDDCTCALFDIDYRRPPLVWRGWSYLQDALGLDGGKTAVYQLHLRVWAGTPVAVKAMGLDNLQSRVVYLRGQADGVRCLEETNEPDQLILRPGHGPAILDHCQPMQPLTALSLLAQSVCRLIPPDDVCDWWRGLPADDLQGWNDARMAALRLWHRYPNDLWDMRHDLRRVTTYPDRLPSEVRTN